MVASFALTRNLATGAEVWRSPNGADWTEVASDGFGIQTTTGDTGWLRSAVICMLLRAIQRLGEVWRTADGTTWEQVGFGGWGDSDNWGSYWGNSIAVRRERLLVGTVKPHCGGGEVWLYSAQQRISASGDEAVGTCAEKRI